MLAADSRFNLLFSIQQALNFVGLYRKIDIGSIGRDGEAILSNLDRFEYVVGEGEVEMATSHEDVDVRRNEL